ncbi:TonB-dependent receptor plug domain-containing protein [Catenovulum maritimum]|uniref:TonB-dependent receptor plug domain-containing protein n=1 Tax=Catenovulum maritimum TaxID=1513271 RepID=UPI00069D8F94|nr:TonB-dependent receptor [Catenovulum maritimum]
MNTRISQTLITLVSGMTLGMISQPIIAAESTQTAEAEIESIKIIGSRVSGRSVEDMPVPVDILSAEALTGTGQVEVGRMLQAIAPSFNFSSSAISDGTDALRPATLRGLGPDQTLVLINGKRRHQASLIHINTSVGRGTAGTDLNAIPAASIKRIDVLRDGAAAQYGSDAIAGIINIVLKDRVQNSGLFKLSYGEYAEGDGETFNLDVSKGIEIAEDGFLTASFNLRDRSPTNRAGLHGSCQFQGCVEQNGVLVTSNPREINAPRNTFRIGDADSQQVALVLNAGYDFKSSSLAAFLTYSSRENESAAFFRHNNNSGGNAKLQDGDATIPAGFLPKINSTIDDLSFNVGYELFLDDGATFELSYTTGVNQIEYTTKDSINASYSNFLRYNDNLSASEIRNRIPRQAKAYGLELSLQTLNMDYSKDFIDFNLSAGAELRTDGYKILPGDEYAYRDYDTSNGTSIYQGMSNGTGSEDASGGIQGFPGISPLSSVNESRNVKSIYVDVETDIVDDVILSGALRYDNYEGFGGTINYKLAANWSITDEVKLRSALSSGFRAPSMQQLYFNNISTQFVSLNGQTVAQVVGTFRNDSQLAKSVGIPSLKEEESTNFSLGTVLKLDGGINLTVDYYRIDIDDRIVVSNRLGQGLSNELDAALVSSGASAGQFFLNGADTETEGVDLVATWGTDAFSGSLDFTFAANFTKTDVTKLFTPDNSALTNVSVSDVFSEQDISIIEEWQPEDRISLSSLYKSDKFKMNLAFNRYGEYTVTDGGRQTYGAEVLTDINLSYQVSESTAVSIGANNLFDVTPDKNTIGNSRTGRIEDSQGNLVVDSAGVFQYSRRSAPFGFNGAYYYAGVEYKF